MKKFLSVLCFFIFLNANMLYVDAMTDTEMSKSQEYAGGYTYDEYVSAWERELTYPIVPEDEKWKELSYAEQLKLLNMPEEMLKNSSTDQLMDIFLDYPFLIDVLLFENEENAIQYLKRVSNICDELFSREDISSKMLKEYDELTVDYSMLSVEYEGNSQNVFKDSGYIKELFFKTYFAEVFSELTDDEQECVKMLEAEKKELKSGYCEDYVTGDLFYILVDDMDAKQSLYTNGFSWNGKTKVYAYGAEGYVGTYTLYGQTVGCYKYKSGEYSQEEINDTDAAIAEAHSTWTKIHPASKKYNCHSYAWISPYASNVYWLNNPDFYANSSSFSYINRNGSANGGDRVIIRDSETFGDGFENVTDALHSVIVSSSGSNMASIVVTSKLGACGVYDTTLADMMVLYGGNSYEVYR